MKSRALVGRILYTTLIAAGLALGSPIASAQNVGFAGPSYIGCGSFPTGAKAQSKLWFHDGKWWGSLWSEPLRKFTIHRFEHSSQNWTDTGIIIDPRHNSHSDCMMDGNQLYVGSHRFLANGNATGNPIGLYRFTYQDVQGVPIPHVITFVRDGRTYWREEYVEPRPGVPLDSALFDPAQWAEKFGTATTTP